MIRLETKYVIERHELDRFKDFIARWGFRVSNRFCVGNVYIDETAQQSARDPFNLDEQIEVAYLWDSKLTVRDSSIPGADALDKIVQEYIALTTAASDPSHDREGLPAV